MRLLSLSEVSIQKRTSPDKFTGKLGIRDFEIIFAFSLVLAFELTGQSSPAPGVDVQRVHAQHVAAEGPPLDGAIGFKCTTRRGGVSFFKIRSHPVFLILVNSIFPDGENDSDSKWKDRVAMISPCWLFTKAQKRSAGMCFESTSRIRLNNPNL